MNYEWLIPVLLLVSISCSLPEDLDNGLNPDDILNISGGNENIGDSEVKIIRLDVNGSDQEMLSDMMEAYNSVKDQYKYVRVEAFRQDKPYWALNYNGSDLYWEDIRSPEWRIADDLLALNFHGSVMVSGYEIIFNGEYSGDEDNFTTDLFSAALIGFEYAPWTEHMAFVLGPVEITIYKNDLLDYMEDKISEDEMISKLIIYKNDYQ